MKNKKIINGKTKTGLIKDKNLKTKRRFKND